MKEEFDQAMVVSGDNIDSIDKKSPPALNKCYVEACLAKIQAENIDLPEGLPAYPTGASSSHVNKAGGLALTETDRHDSDKGQINKLRIFEEDNAFIKFDLGISTAAYRPLQLHNPKVQTPSRPKSYLHTPSHMCSEPILFERAPPDLGCQGGRNLVPRPATLTQGRRALTFRPRQHMPIQGAHAESGVQPLPMSTKLLAHLPKTNICLNAETLQHLECAYKIWYPDPLKTMAENRSTNLEDHASDSNNPDWPAEKWLSIERNAIGNANSAREA
ncbi:hypothetical protein MMC32_007421 [Xylographa parallela]|nr:hypothetical protein [Xylographa parallela]